MIDSSEPKMKKSYHSKTVPAADADSISPIRGGRDSLSAMLARLPVTIANGGQRASQVGRRSGDLGPGRGIGQQRAAVRLGDLARQQHLLAVADEGMQMCATVSPSSDS